MELSDRRAGKLLHFLRKGGKNGYKNKNLKRLLVNPRGRQEEGKFLHFLRKEIGLLVAKTTTSLKFGLKCAQNLKKLVRFALPWGGARG